MAQAARSLGGARLVARATEERARRQVATAQRRSDAAVARATAQVAMARIRAERAERQRTLAESQLAVARVAAPVPAPPPAARSTRRLPRRLPDSDSDSERAPGAEQAAPAAVPSCPLQRRAAREVESLPSRPNARQARVEARLGAIESQAAARFERLQLCAPGSEQHRSLLGQHQAQLRQDEAIISALRAEAPECFWQR